MEFIIAFLLLIMVALILKQATTSRKSPTDPGWPFYAKKVLSKPEQVLYFRLVDALPNYIILTQVQLSRFLGVKKGHNFHASNNRINRMSVDFLICRKDSSVLAAVELDDNTHEKEYRKKSDQKKNAAITAAGIPIIRWKVQEIPNAIAINNATSEIDGVTSHARR